MSISVECSFAEKMEGNLVFCNSKNEKLSYRRDSARQRSLRRSRSFKVIDVGTNRRPVCNFLFVNNTNFHPIWHCFPAGSYRTVFVKLSHLTRMCFSLKHSFSVTSAIIAVSHILLNSEFFQLYFCCRQCGSSYKQFDVVSLQKFFG